MKVLVTGANGFIGQALCKELVLDHDVVPVTRCEVPLVGGLKPVSIGKMTDKTDWKALLAGVDVVIHTAGKAAVAPSQPEALWAVNVDATLNLARQSAELGVKRFIFLSSVKVHGELSLPEKPLTEESPFNPMDQYGQSKLAAEQGLLDRSNQNDTVSMDIVIIRPPMVYGHRGENDRGTSNFSRLVSWVEKGVPLPLGAIHNKRSLIGLDNLVDFISLCMEHPKAANQVFLVSDEDDLSTTELLRVIGQSLGKPPRLLAIPGAWLKLSISLLGRGDMAQRLCDSLQVDIHKAKELLGWEPPYSIEKGLEAFRSDTVSETAADDRGTDQLNV